MQRQSAAHAMVLAVLTVTLGLAIPQSHVTAAGPEYTWNLAALGQGGWIGGPLFEDGSVGGGGALSIENGQVVARFRPTTWTEDANEVITVCWDVVIIKGPSGALPPSLCASGEATGVPTRVILFGSEHILRITENR